MPDIVEYKTNQKGLEMFLYIIGKAFEQSRPVITENVATVVFLSYRPW